MKVGNINFWNHPYKYENNKFLKEFLNKWVLFKQDFNSFIESLCGENTFLPGIFQSSTSEIPGIVEKKNLQTNWNPSLHCGWGCLARHHQTGHGLCVAIQLTLLFCKGRKRNQFSQIYDFHHRPLSRSCAFSVLRTGCPNPNCISNTNLQKNVEIPKFKTKLYFFINKSRFKNRFPSWSKQIHMILTFIWYSIVMYIFIFKFQFWVMPLIFG